MAYLKRTHTKKMHSRRLLFLTPWPDRLAKKLENGWTALKRGFRIANAEEIESLKERAKWLERRISTLAHR